MTDTIEIFMGDLKCALQRFKPEPGDVFVITIPGEITKDMVDRISSAWKDGFPDTKVAILSDHIEVKLRAAADP